MSATSITQHDLAIKGGQFVAPTADEQYAAEFALGRKAYRENKRRSWCRNGAMRDGWDAAAFVGQQQYARQMLAEGM